MPPHRIGPMIMRSRVEKAFIVRPVDQCKADHPSLASIADKGVSDYVRTRMRKIMTRVRAGARASVNMETIETNDREETSVRDGRDRNLEGIGSDFEIPNTLCSFLKSPIEQWASMIRRHKEY